MQGLHNTLYLPLNRPALWAESIVWRGSTQIIEPVRQRRLNPLAVGNTLF